MVYRHSARADDAFWVAWTCVLAPDAVADWALPLKLAEKALASVQVGHQLRLEHLERHTAPQVRILGQEDEYRRASRALLDRFGASKEARLAERTGRACLFLPAPADELRRAAYPAKIRQKSYT